MPEAVFTVDQTVGTLIYADDAVWAFDASGVTRVDPQTNTAHKFTLLTADGGERFSALGSVGFGSIWVGDFDNDQVRRYDIGDGSLASVIETNKPEGLLADDSALWVTAHRTGSVVRVDPATEQIVATVVVGTTGNSGPEALVAINGQIWVGIPNALTVAGIDPQTNTMLGSINVARPGIPCGGIGTFGDRLYVSGCALTPTLSVVDIVAQQSVASPQFDGSVVAPVTVGSRLWLGVVANDHGGSLLSVDPLSLEQGRRIPVNGAAPSGLLAAAGSVWLSVEIESEHLAWLLRLPVSAFS